MEMGLKTENLILVSTQLPFYLILATFFDNLHKKTVSLLKLCLGKWIFWSTNIPKETKNLSPFLQYLAIMYDFWADCLRIKRIFNYAKLHGSIMIWHGWVWIKAVQKFSSTKKIHTKTKNYISRSRCFQFSKWHSLSTSCA